MGCPGMTETLPLDWTPLTLDVARRLVGREFEVKCRGGQPSMAKGHQVVNDCWFDHMFPNGGRSSLFIGHSSCWMVRTQPDPDPYAVIHRAMEEFVTVLCEGAWDFEEDPHEDVVALAYAFPDHLTERWPRWEGITTSWFESGLAPDVVGFERSNTIAWSGPFLDAFDSDPHFAASMVAGAIWDGLDDGLITMGGDDERLVQQCEILLALAGLVRPTLHASMYDDAHEMMRVGLLHSRIIQHIEQALDEADAADAKREAVERAADSIGKAKAAITTVASAAKAAARATGNFIRWGRTRSEVAS